MSSASSPRREYSIGDLPIAVAEYGNAEAVPVILLHGAARSLEDWQPVASLLAQDYRVISLDFRNHGASGDALWSWPAVVADVRRVVDSLTLQHYYLVGHSLGGMVAAHYAASAAQMGCIAAVNLDGHGSGLPEQFAELAGEDIPQRLAELSALSLATVEGLQQPLSEEQLGQYAEAIRAQLPDPDCFVAGLYRAAAKGEDGLYRMRPSMDSYVPMHEALEAVDLPSVYAECRCPLLVVKTSRVEANPAAAELDWLPAFTEAHHQGLLACFERIAEQQPLMQFKTMDAGHAMLTEQPEATAALLREYFATQT